MNCRSSLLSSFSLPEASYSNGAAEVACDERARVEVDCHGPLELPAVVGRLREGEDEYIQFPFVLVGDREGEDKGECSSRGSPVVRSTGDLFGVPPFADERRRDADDIDMGIELSP